VLTLAAEGAVQKEQYSVFFESPPLDFVMTSPSASARGRATRLGGTASRDLTICPGGHQ
jgi:hypothetical protein